MKNWLSSAMAARHGRVRETDCENVNLFPIKDSWGRIAKRQKQIRMVLDFLTLSAGPAIC